MSEATLSARNQIVIRREARQALRVKAGDTLLVVVRGDRVIVLQKPKTHHAAIRGLGVGVYPVVTFRNNARVGTDTEPGVSSASPQNRTGYQYLLRVVGRFGCRLQNLRELEQVANSRRMPFQCHSGFSDLLSLHFLVGRSPMDRSRRPRRHAGFRSS